MDRLGRLPLKCDFKFNALHDLLEWSLKNCKNSELKARGFGVKVLTETLSYISGIHLAKSILAHMDILKKTPQSTHINDSRRRTDSGENTSVDTIRGIFFNSFWAKLQGFVTDHNWRAQVKKKPTTKCNIVYNFRDHPYTAVDDYRLKFYAVFDMVISCIQYRFTQDDYEIISTLEKIVLKAANGKITRLIW